MGALAVIEYATIFRMVNDVGLIKEIPCLQGKKDVFRQTMNSGCGACAHKKATQRRDAVNKIKMCLAALSPEKRETLKIWLGAEKARVVYSNAGGQIMQVDF